MSCHKSITYWAFFLQIQVETEGNYVEVLQMLKKNFIRGLISVKDNDKKVIFMNIPELVETHTAFYAGVRDAGNKNTLKIVHLIFFHL